MEKKRYAQVGTGGRARMFYEAIATRYQDSSALVAFCDMSQVRMDFSNKILVEKCNHSPVPTYKHTEFDRMIDEQKPDVIIVTTVDRTHDQYIIRAMEKGCDVICEKPITTDNEKGQAILDAQKRYGRSIRVTFNYRYAPHHSKVRELIASGVIGEVYSVHFEWLLNTEHGADYYRRWHRNKVNSGGLLVHKSTHHFDLVNFWLGTQPKTVFAFGALNFYGQAAAQKRGVERFYARCHGSEAAKGDPFAIDMENNPTLKGLYLDAEAESGYIRDRSVFSDDISIEDTMAVLVKYKSGAMLSYSLNSYLPWEGFNVAINGSKGRIEYTALERPYINAGGKQCDEGATVFHKVRVCPLLDTPYEVEVQTKEGGHGGGDPTMLDDIFLENPPFDPLHRSADHTDGLRSILTGIAANKSIASGLPVDVDTLLHW
ncbi:Gfo/Idh/MocA family oxidoreductase [Sphaerochaeta sp.]|jgi:predicted dehydrogenase|uniref:Gfo/Idh/MocA family protein n=1 Tax=Sphaerochaeta sp. TaxID=1972642 RepID=UPI0017BEAB25|nr:Gfo/Idh/MocA family oxidoreductase [Sphaerochaeta sp.]MDD3424788.1 Gfo/Idh/MocA family oxidoreductase [Sphaerochaeta sp.]NLA99238.1 Gfo/Idh/MocA family oxidoreductase [Spirochaetales bacterium]